MEIHIARPLIDTFVPCLYFVRVLLKTNNKALHDLWLISYHKLWRVFCLEVSLVVKFCFIQIIKFFLTFDPYLILHYKVWSFFCPYKCFHLSSFVTKNKAFLDLWPLPDFSPQAVEFYPLEVSLVAAWVAVGLWPTHWFVWLPPSWSLWGLDANASSRTSGPWSPWSFAHL